MLNIEFKCRKITPANLSEAPIAIEQPTFDNIENLKRENGMSRIPGEAYPVVLLLQNRTNEEITDLDIKIRAKIKLADDLDKFYQINIDDPSVKLGNKQSLPITLFDMSGLTTALVILDTVNYRVKKIYSTGYQTNAPLIYDMTYLQNNYNGFRNIYRITP
ncbi:MAG TPA: hypothetical protein VJS91_01320 [Nitrososphaeraceae archaeon]|nr:hypothetical protein [Nitrososphaeraceae archaeon]